MTVNDNWIEFSDLCKNNIKGDKYSYLNSLGLCSGNHMLKLHIPDNGQTFLTYDNNNSSMIFGPTDVKFSNPSVVARGKYGTKPLDIIPYIRIAATSQGEDEKTSLAATKITKTDTWTPVKFFVLHYIPRTLTEHFNVDLAQGYYMNGSKPITSGKNAKITLGGQPFNMCSTSLGNYTSNLLLVKKGMYLVWGKAILSGLQPGDNVQACLSSSSSYDKDGNQNIVNIGNSITGFSANNKGTCTVSVQPTLVHGVRTVTDATTSSNYFYNATKVRLNVRNRSGARGSISNGVYTNLCAVYLGDTWA